MNGFSITLTPEPDERDRVIAELWECGTTGITEDEDWLRAFFDEDADAVALASRFAMYRPQVEPEHERDWVAHAQSMWQPFAVGERFYLVPEWLDDPAPCGRVRLRIRPGLACGSGAHPATQLCLQALERTVTEDATLLDVGTGSGILAEAALLLGARSVFACDIDHNSAVVAKGNFSAMPVAPVLFTGSLRCMRDGAVDIVVANLNAATITMLGRDLVRVARGRIIVSGFREAETGRVAAVLGRDARDHIEVDDWTCLIF
jgi:ribosomal protein L11 methyltransferase